LCPTDAGYTFVWTLDARDAEERVRRLRALDTKHPFTVLCASLSDVGRMARLGDTAFRLMKSLTPGPCTFVLTASSDLPRRLKLDKRRSIGVRRIEHPVAQALLQAVEQPLLSTSVALPDAEDLASHVADDVADRLLERVDFMLDSGDCEPGPTSVIDATGDVPELRRQGFRPLEL
ncbi:MAG TPA: Sua5/YciO/YrdC/YwlC family protein, partial [Xanthomonadaceae bacterium]|nr:Sua5/YciO/YrdC/YwlC family protein [Xanthomonadaceae bacterium]